MENLQTALMLMLVGMVTVFVILILVIQLGKLIIVLVNKFAPEEVKKTEQVAVAGIPANVKSVIDETVKAITSGKGSVKNIEKL